MDKLPPEALFSHKAVGWSSVIAAALMLAALFIAFTMVVRTIARPASFLERYIESKPTSLEASMAIALEYESMAIRTQAIQVAFGFACGLILLAVGLILVALGATGTIQFSGSAAGGSFNLSNATPGVVAIVVGGLIIALAVSKDVRRTFSASMEEPNAAVTRTESKPPQRSGTSDGELRADDSLPQENTSHMRIE